MKAATSRKSQAKRNVRFRVAEKNFIRDAKHYAIQRAPSRHTMRAFAAMESASGSVELAPAAMSFDRLGLTDGRCIDSYAEKL
jgi:hypothetical protein